MSAAPSSVERPGFSIVVPTHGRADQVAELLQSLDKARTGFTGASEAILVDSSDPGQAARIATLAHEHGACVLPAANHVGRKRNMGIEAAVYDKILFIDSDCRAAPTLLTEHEQAHQAVADDGVAGVLGLTEWSGRAGRVWRVLELTSSMTAAFRFALWLKEPPWGTCTNLSIRRQALRAVGGFDEAFPLRVYGEDVDLGLRLGQAGYRLVAQPTAVVYHDRASLNTFSAALRKSVLTGRADFHLGRRHPRRLALEYPGVAALMLVLAVVGLIPWLTAGRLAPLLLPAVYGALYGLTTAALMVGLKRRSPLWLLPYWGVTLLELAFEAGRLLESLRHARLNRLWTKFVYVEAQLLAERERRIVQSWSLALAALLALLFLELWS